jgi:hypothetical protein
VWHVIPGVRAYYHPELPSALPLLPRLLLSLFSVTVSLWGMVVLYVYLMGAAAAPGRLTLPALSTAQFIGCALANGALISLPLDMALSVVLAAAAARLAGARYPALGGEQARRAGALAHLGGAPPSLLLAMLQAAHPALPPLGKEQAAALSGGGEGESAEAAQAALGSLVQAIQAATAAASAAAAASAVALLRPSTRPPSTPSQP